MCCSRAELSSSSAKGTAQAEARASWPSGCSSQAGELARLTERLYRVEGSRSRASGGSGLGLSIASALVNAHGATLTPSPSTLGGLRWTLRFPLLAAN